MFSEICQTSITCFGFLEMFSLDFATYIIRDLPDIINISLEISLYQNTRGYIVIPD